jgi:glutamate decarboxylase
VRARRFKIPEQSIPKDAAYQIINDELMLDGNPRLNLASFVTTWMEPECDKLIQASINKNYVDMDEYPVTTELQVRTHCARDRSLALTCCWGPGGHL